MKLDVSGGDTPGWGRTAAARFKSRGGNFFHMGYVI